MQAGNTHSGFAREPPRRKGERQAPGMVPVDLSTEMVFPGVPSSQRDGNSAPWHSVTQPPRVTGGYAASPRGDCHGARSTRTDYGLSHLNDG